MTSKSNGEHGAPSGKMHVMAGWKTFIFNGLVALAVIAVQVLQYLGQFPWPEVLPSKEAGWVALTLGVINIILRHITSGPAGWVSGEEK